MVAPLRPVRSQGDLEYNLNLLYEAVTNITADQIVSGEITPAQLNGDFMPRSGGAFTGAVSGPAFSIDGVAVSLFGDSYLKAEADARFVAVGDAYGTGDTYSQTEVDTLLANLNCSGEIYESSSGSNINLASAGQWYQWISSTPGSTTGTGVTIDGANDRLQIAAAGAGIYRVTAVASVKSTSGPFETLLCVHKNAAPQDNLRSDHYIDASGNMIQLAASGLLMLAEGDSVDLRFGSLSSSKDIQVHRCNLTISRQTTA